MKVYIDFDGVILDTTKTIIKEYYKIEKTEFNQIKIHEFFCKVNWMEVIKESDIIANSIELIKNSKLNIAILTKVNSLENEGESKIKFLRAMGVTNEIILVPYNLKKCDVVSAKGNLLIDDTISNLDAWKLNGGDTLFFSKDGSDIDEWKVKNKKYKMITSLEILKNDKKSK